MSSLNALNQQPGGLLDAELLRPSAAVLGAHVALGAAIEQYAVAATGHDPTTLDLLTRLALSADHQLRAVELCRQLRLSPSHVSRMLDRAEAADLVRRGPDPTDRRAHLVAMTEAGWSTVGQFAPRLESVVREVIYDALTTEEIEAMVMTLGKIEQAAFDYPRDDIQVESGCE